MVKYVTVWVYLPEFYNPDEEGKKVKIKEHKFKKTAKEIVEEISGGGTWHPNKTGFWIDEGIIYYDECRILEVDIVGSKRNIEWIKEYAKMILLERFQQKAIYIKLLKRVSPIIVKISKDEPRK